MPKETILMIKTKKLILLMVAVILAAGIYLMPVYQKEPDFCNKLNDLAGNKQCWEQNLLLSGKDIGEAGAFCAWAKKQVGGTNDVEGACFHGIGHGLSENHDKK